MLKLFRKYRFALSPQSEKAIANALRLIASEGLKTIEEIGDVAEDTILERSVSGAVSSNLSKDLPATAELIKSLDGISDAAIRIGSILLIKHTINDRARLVIETITPKLRRELDKNPQLLSDPRKALEFLDGFQSMSS